MSAHETAQEWQERHRLLKEFAEAARAAGLTAVIEEHSVDLRIMDGNQVVAAIRMWLRDDLWVQEYPARTGEPPLASGSVLTMNFASTDTKLTDSDFSGLDHWWARIPDTGRTRPPAPAWMRRAYTTT